MLKKIAALVQSQRFCALATCGCDAGGEGGPHVSLMAYAAPADASAFWMASPPDTRKVRNLAASPQASLLVEDRARGLALTVTARCEPFATAAEEATARATLTARHPELAVFLAGRATLMLRFSPLRFQLLTGPSKEICIEVEKILDGSVGRA